MSNSVLSFSAGKTNEMTPAQRIASHATDLGAVAGWTFFGLSLAQINTLLQSIALTLSILLSLVALLIHGRNLIRWLKRKFDPSESKDRP